MSTDTEVLTVGRSRTSRGAPSRRAVRRTDRVWRNALWVLPAVALLAVFVYVPLFQNLFISTVDWNIYTGETVFEGADNYVDLMGDRVFWSSLVNNIAYAAVSVGLQVFGALVLAAMVESVRNVRIRNTLRAVYFVPSAISITVSGLLFYFIYEPNIGFLNTFLEATGLGALAQPWLGQSSTVMGAIIAMSQWQGFGYSTLLFAVAIQRIPANIHEAATIDGAGPIRRLFTFTIPLVREMTALLIIVTVNGAFQVFNEVMVMTGGGPNNASHVLGTWLYQQGFIQGDFGYAAAIAVVIFAVTLVLAIVQLMISNRRRVEW